ncbi:chemotaxis protein CheW [Archaeoglobus profundus]|uniref:CheW protein n=1 Tax=Archaeoglobus profundus (strain DSM 5631 / JCM 9629 / NBRC 100127 / Av18) TaxID=572546 RepID=D2RE83_ARCPA|nr:chemotaxis protein CheW [Archaeoglobus profundus]ADB58427.1 CheW protein [Archaeoglobus profundus DSM 5631]
MQALKGGETIQVIVFSLGEERYGVDITQVREIIRPTKITRIPNAPDFVEGVINLRGQITTIINLRKRFGLPPKEIDNDTRIIVVEYNDAVIGMMVDTVNEVKYLTSDDIEPLPSIVTSRSEAKFLKGVGKLPDGLLILIDLNKVLSEEEIEGIKV